MLIVDTDHLSEMDRESVEGLSLRRRLTESTERVATTIISIEEQLRGLLALVKSIPRQDPHHAVLYYLRLQKFVSDLSQWDILPWTEEAADKFKTLRRTVARIGTMDLKIAALVPTNNGTLLSRNLRDFRRIPDLHVEDWLTEALQ